MIISWISVCESLVSFDVEEGKEIFTVQREEYLVMKKNELKNAEKTAAQIEADPRDFVKYRDSRPITDVKHMIETSAAKYADHVAFYEKPDRNSPYGTKTYKEMLEDINAMGTALIELGLKDKRVAVIGANSSRWALSYLAIVCGTGIVVPFDRSLSDESLEEMVKMSDVDAVICDQKYVEVFANIKKKRGNHLKTIIDMQCEEDTKNVLSWTSLLENGKKLLAEGDRRFVDAEIIRDEMSILLFTSGTTGLSKGVMLSHGNIAEDLMAAPTVLQVNDDDIFFSVLPLHHTYECTCGFLMPLYKGAAIAYCEGLKYITKNLQEVRPTMFLGVPAIFELLYKKIWQNIEKQGKGNTVRKAIKVNNVTKKVGLDIGKIFFKDITAVFGGRMRILICGGAAINPDVLNGIRDFGIQALQGYGLTECAPLAALNPDTAPVANSVGVAFPGINLDVKNVDETGIGELAIQGANVMLGYYNMPELTNEVIVDGWYYTGDMGYMDEKGYAYITGRKKNVIITKNGENVFPEEVEYALNLSPYVLESMVFEKESSRKEDKILAAAIVADVEEIEMAFGKDVSHRKIEGIINDVVKDYNKKRALFKRIKHVIVRETPLKKNTSNKIVRFEEENKK
ncbi:MAG: AMP-binding protein [Clostridiales bacterium]|nr:AMP-binding protein [Clostridiales bacterium]